MTEQGPDGSIDDLRRAPAHSLAAVLRIRDFRNLWIGLGLSSLGDWMGLLALTAMANEMAEGYGAKNYAIATVLFLRVLPALVMSPIAGYVADRLDRRLTLIWGDYLRGLLFLTIPLVGTLWWVFVVTVLVEAISLVWGPAKDATVPNLVPRHRLEAANQVSLATTYGSALPAAAIFTGLTLLDKLYRHALRLVRPRPDRHGAVLQRGVVHHLRHRDRHPQAHPARTRRTPTRDSTAWKVVVDGWKYVGTTPRRTRPGDRHHRRLRRRRCGHRAGPDLRLRPRRRRRQATACCSAPSSWGSGSGMWRGPRLLHGLSRRRLFGIALTMTGLLLFPIALVQQLEIVVALTLLLGFFAGVGVDHRQHPARAGGARRGARAHVRVRRLDDPAGARSGAGSGTAHRRRDRHPGHRPGRRERRAATRLQRRGVHLPHRGSADDRRRRRVLSSDGRPQGDLTDARPAQRLRRLRRLHRDRLLRGARGR